MSTEAIPLTDQLEKAELDNRQYWVFRLSNDLEVTVIHDPTTDKAGASVMVSAGSFLDDIEGTAHYVEVRRPNI